MTDSHSLLARATSLMVGIAMGVVLHYILYRLGLPLRPFIYAAF